MCNKYSAPTLSGTMGGAGDAKLNPIPFWFPRSSLGIGEGRQLAMLPCGQLCCDRDMDKGLVEMTEGIQWLPGNGYFVLYKGSESESINHLSSYCVCICVYLHTLAPKLRHAALKIIIKETGDKDYILKH